MKISSSKLAALGGMMAKTKSSMTTEELAEWVIAQTEQMTEEERLSARIALIKEFSPERVGAEPKFVL
jgi:hypothetical protein